MPDNEGSYLEQMDALTHRSLFQSLCHPPLSVSSFGWHASCTAFFSTSAWDLQIYEHHITTESHHSEEHTWPCKASNDSLILVIEISGNCGTQLANLFEEYTYKLHKQELQVHQSFCLELFREIFLCQETYLFAAAKRYCAPSSSSTSIFKIDCRKFSIPGKLQNSSSTAQLEPQRKPLIVYTRYTSKLEYSQNKK